MKQYAIIILAAGSSSRLGYPKQLIKHNNKSFIQHALAEAKKASENIIIVLGANFELVKDEIENRFVRIIHNNNWEEGIASSIRCGLAELLKQHASADAAIFMVCDQPFVNASLLNDLITTYEETGKPIIACAYKDATGTPVLFDKSFFPALLALNGQSGAKKIISENKGSTLTVPFPLGYIDIDTKEDYENLQKNNLINE